MAGSNYKQVFENWVISHAYNKLDEVWDYNCGEEIKSLFSPKGGDLVYKTLVESFGKVYPLRLWDGSIVNVFLSSFTRTIQSSHPAYRVYHVYVHAQVKVLNLNEVSTAVRRATMAFAQRLLVNHKPLITQIASRITESRTVINGRQELYQFKIDAERIEVSSSGENSFYFLFGVSNDPYYFPNYFRDIGLQELQSLDMQIGFAEAVISMPQLEKESVYPEFPNNIYKWTLRVETHAADIPIPAPVIFTQVIHLSMKNAHQPLQSW